MKIIYALLVSASLPLLSACAPKYLAPAPNLRSDYYKVIPVEYDEAWNAMIDYVSSTFFAIDNFEKDSGLLTLKFGDSNVANYVDCGTWDGSPYIQRDLGFSLNGRMNIRIKDLGNQGTGIRISTNYTLRDNAGNVYNFRENEPATVTIRNATDGTPPTRTCQSNQSAEKVIISGIDALASK